MITKQQAFQQSQHFFKITKSALEFTKIVEKLPKFGEVEMVGSYKYGLMGKADVDFHVYTSGKPSASDVANLAQEYITTDKIIKLSVVNYTEFPPSHPSFPPGIWLGIKIDVGGELVNIDVWFLRRADEHTDEFATKMPKEWWKNLNAEQKEAIVYLKAMSSNGELKREFMSTEIYRAVVLGGVSTVEQLYEWDKKESSQ